MHIGKGQVVELILRDGLRHARISCLSNLIPSPGQYLIAGTTSDSFVPDPVFYTDSAPDGLIVAPAPVSWRPGTEIHLRGPLGRGFELPVSAKRIALVAIDDLIVRLRPLIRPALSQRAAVVLVTDRTAENLPDDVEVQPLSALGEIIRWADWVALDIARGDLSGLKERLGNQNQTSAMTEAEIFVRTPVPCGGMAECGICAVVTKSGWKMACKEGPVFRWSEF
jgi:hypothetical protein